GKTFEFDLGTTGSNGTSITTPGIDIKGTQLRSFQGTLDSKSKAAITIGGSSGLTITPGSLTIGYQAADAQGNGAKVSGRGDASVQFPGLKSAIDVKLGDSTNPGIVYQQGKGLVAFDMEIDSEDTDDPVSFQVGGLTVEP